jgi:hypothetical protein
MKDSHCFNDLLSMEVAAVVNTLFEVIIATLPLVAVFKFRVNRNQRWGVIGILSLGYFVAFAGCFRAYYIFKAFITYDLTWFSGPQWICSEIELDLALVCLSTMSHNATSNILICPRLPPAQRL